MIICLLIPLSTVSASDVNNTADDQVLSATPSVDTLSASVNLEQENDTLSVQENENLLSAGLDSGSDNLLGDDSEESNVGSYSDLSELIKLSEGSLILQKDYKYTTGDSIAITINKEITIDGNNHIIDGNNLARAFIINADNVKITNLNIQNMLVTTNYQGVITWNGRNGELNHVNMNNTLCTCQNLNYISSGVFWTGSNGIINNSIFNNSKLQYGPTSYDGVMGVLTDGIGLKIENSKFDNMDGYNVVEATMPSDKTSIYNCTFNRHTSISSNTNWAGYTIFSRRGSIEIDKCNFTNANIYASSVLAIRVNDNITNCYFENNTQHYNSGRIGSIVSQGVNLFNCTFNSNNPRDCVVDLYPGYNVDNCTFINEKSTIFLLGGSNHLNDLKFYKCSNVIVNTGSQNNVFSNTTFENFKDVNYLLRFTGQQNQFINCTFNNNTNLAYAPIVVGGNNVYLNFTKDSKFKQNNFNTSGDIVEIYNETSETYINMDDCPSYIPLKDIYVDMIGGGSGSSPDDRTTLDVAISKISYGNTIYIKNGVYNSTISTGQELAGNIEGEGNNVILNQYTFIMLSDTMSIKYIIFNNTCNSLQTYSNNEFINCTFNNTQTSSLFTTDGGRFFRNNLFENISIINGKITSKIFGRDMEHITIKNLKVENTTFQYLAANQVAFIGLTFYNVTLKNCTFDALFNNTNAIYLRNFNFTLFNIDNCTSNDILISLNAGDYVSYSHNSINDFYISNLINRYNYNLFDVYYDCALNNINIVNLTNSVGSVVNIVYTGDSVDGLNIKNVTANKIISADNVYSLSDVNLDNVTSTNSFDIFQNMALDNLTFYNVNFTSGNMLTLPAYSSVSNSSFTDFSGHIIVNGDKVGFTNTSFTRGDNPSLNGSAVEFVSGNYMSFTDCNFTDNNGLNGAVYFVNGCLRPSFLDCNFTDNIAEEVAGAIYFKYNTGESTVVTFGGITEDTVAGFNGEKLNGVYGNLTHAVSIVYVINDTEGKSGAEANAKTPETPGTFNTAYGIAGKNCIFVFVRSGDIFNYTDSQLKGQLMDSLDEGWTFNGNNTTIENLRFHVTNGGLKAYNITFKGNDAGSVVIVDDENVLFDNCSFIDNGGDSVEYGGAIQINAKNTNITNCTFKDNAALNNTNGFGGALYVNASYVVIKNNTFDHNRAYNTGSHIYITENNQDITINNNTFKNSNRLGSGSSSGVVIQGNNINVVDNIFDNNTGFTGSALSLIGNVNYININNNVFENNTASGNGSVYLSYTNRLDTVINVNNNTFKNNSALNGGALYIGSLTRPDLLSLEDNSYSNNSAVNGGAVYINADNVVLRNIKFNNNNASLGGALYVNADDVRVSDSEFKNNNALIHGSAIYVADDKFITLTNTKLTGNSAGEDIVSDKKYDDISYAGILPAIKGKFIIDDLSEGALYYINRTEIKYYIEVYITNDGTGTGGINDPTNWENAITKILDDGIIYIVTDNFKVKDDMIALLENANLTNVTIVGINNTSIKRASTNENKYLFNPLKKIKNLSLNNYSPRH